MRSRYTEDMTLDEPLGSKRPEDGDDRRRTESAVLGRLFGEQSESPGRFRRIRFLGRGSMGSVELAEDTMLDREVALKRLVPDRAQDARARERIQREARSLAQVEHPAVVGIHDVLEEGEGLTLVMEYVPGPTLREWLKQPRSRSNIVAVLCSAASGLQAAHARGLVHRDFKPENVIVLDDRAAKVIDFGLAWSEPVSVTRSEADAHEDGSLTQTGAVLGTPAYMAPEQVLNRAVDARTDQFSFCVAAWEAFVGTRPFGGRTLQAIAENAAKGTVDPSALERLPRAVRPVLLRGLSADPEARYPDMDALASALAGRTPKRYWAFGVLGAAGVAGALLWPRDDPPTPALAVDPCASAAAPAERVWTPARADALRERMSAVAPDYTPAVARRVTDRADAWVEQWAEQALLACRAGQDQAVSAAGLLATQTCLSVSLDEFDALLSEFDESSGRGVTRVLTTLDRIPAPTRCARRAFVDAAFGTKATPEVETARRQRNLAQVELARGQYESALPLAVKARAAVPLGVNLALDAEIGLTMARAHFQLGHTDEASQAYLDAANAAESSSYDELAATVWTELTRSAGVQRIDAERARFYVERADAAVRRLGDPPLRRALVEQRRGQVEIAAGNPVSATPHLQRGLSLVENLPSGQRMRASISMDLGKVAYAQGNFDAAIAAFERVIDANRQAFGERHPAVADARHNLGSIMVADGRLEEAGPVLDAALAGRKLAYGAEHAKVASTLNSIASIAFSQGRYAQALADYTTVAAMFRAARGGPHVSVAEAVANQGRALTGLERFDEADAAFAEATMMLEPLVGSEHLSYADALSGWASSRALAGDAEAAAGLYERTVAIRRRGLGPAAPRTLRTSLALAQARRQAGQLSAARTLVRTVLETPALGEDLTREARLELGWIEDSANRPSAARRAFEQALEGLDADAVQAKADTREAQGWLADHAAP